MDWIKAGAAQQGRAIMAGLLDPVEQVEANLERIERHPDRDRIFARLTPARARAEAIAAHDRARADQRRGLLDGVGLVWKDNIDTAGVATEAGSRLLEGRIPTRDAEILRRATEAGLVCLGKTHMTELAFSGLGINEETATPPNAHDPMLVPGGSSSGTAVAVALGLAPAGIGTDTGGSIRLPSAWNGLVGFKPTTDSLPGEGIVPLCLTFDAPGPLARTVEDCALIHAVLTGGANPDFTGADVAGMHFMVLDGLPFEGAREAPVAAFEAAVDRLARKGARITRIDQPAARDALAVGTPLYAPEAYGLWQDVIEAAPDKMNANILTRFRGGKDMSAPDYVAGWQKLRAARGAWAQAVAGFDAVLLPACPILPPDARRLREDADFFATENMLALRNTRIGNVLGLPGASLPTEVAGCGLMAFGRAGDDLALLHVASAIEAALAGD